MIYKSFNGPKEPTANGFYTPILGTAEFSDCGQYRYTLTRKISSISVIDLHILFIMLNPSTATAETNDPTIRRCMSFAERNGYSRLTVVNLFALRATDPKKLKSHLDPVGPLNDEAIAYMVNKHGIKHTIAAWGANRFAKQRAAEVIKKFGPFQCLGTTKDGSPRHPLYVKSNQVFKELS